MTADKQIKYVTSPVIEVYVTGSKDSKSAPRARYYFAEDKLNGEFIKFCNNLGYWNPDHLDEWLLRFVLWTAKVTNGFLMVTDLQGIKTANGYIFTDPVVLCADVTRFGTTNMGEKGMERVKKASETLFDELGGRGAV